MAMNNILIGKEFYRVSRCGIIPYCNINDDKYMLLLKVVSGLYTDIGGCIRSNETYLDGLEREVFKKTEPRVFTRSTLRDAMESQDAKRVARKIHSTQNTVQLEWLVPITLHHGDTCIEKHKNLEWVVISRIIGYHHNITLLDEPLMNMMPQIAKKL